MAKDNYCIKGQDQRHGEKERYISENEGSAELQNKISLSQNKVMQNSIKTQKHKCQNSKNLVCNETFVIDSHEVHLSLRLQGSSNVYNKPVSVGWPISSLDAESSVKKAPLSKEDCLISEETNSDSEGTTDLAKAVLCSRNKIALALAGITQTKQLRSSQVCSKVGTGQPAGKLCATSQTGKKSCDSFRNNIGESNTKDRQEGTATVIRGPALEQDNKSAKILDSEKCQPQSPSTDGPHPFARRQSVKILPACLEHKTKSSPKTLKLKNCIFDKLGMGASPVKRRRSATLCMLSASERRDGRGTNLEGFSVDSLISSPGSNIVDVLSSHLTTPSVQCHVSPSRPLTSPKTVGRRSSQILPVNEGAMSSASKLTAKKKGTCLQYQKDPLREFQASKGAFHEKEKEFSENVEKLLKAKQCSRDSLRDTKATESYSKKDVCETSRNDRVVKSNSNPQPFISTEEKLNGLVGCHKPVLDKGNCWKTKGEFSPVLIKSRRDSYRDNCSKTPVGNSNFGLSPVIEKDRKKKRGSNLSEMESREDNTLSCTKSKVGVVIGDSAGTAVPSQKKSCSDHHGCFMFNAKRTDLKGDIVHELNDGGELNWKRKVAKKNCRIGIHANKEGSTVRLTVKSPSKKDLEIKEFRTSKLCVSSPSGNTKNRVVLSGNLESNGSPQGSHMRKKRARESIATDTPESLPRKQAKRGSPMSSSFEHAPRSFRGAESLSWQGRESTPVKGNNFKRVRVELFSPQKMQLLSPIRRPEAETCDSVQDAPLSPCKGLGSCDKVFCFDCC